MDNKTDVVNKLPIVVIKKIFRFLEHEKPIFSAKSWCTHTIIKSGNKNIFDNGSGNGNLHFCNSTSINIVLLSLVSKDWANEIIGKIELPWFIGNQKDYYYFSKWSTTGITNQSISKYPKIQFDIDRLEINFPDDLYNYPSLPINIKSISNFSIKELVSLQQNDGKDNHFTELLKLNFKFDDVKNKINTELVNILNRNKQLESISIKSVRDVEMSIDLKSFDEVYLAENQLLSNLSITNIRVVNYEVGPILVNLKQLKLDNVQYHRNHLHPMIELFKGGVGGLTNLTCLKLININILSMNLIIDSLYFNNTIKELSLKEKVCQKDNGGIVLLKSLKLLFQYNTKLETVSIKLRNQGTLQLDTTTTTTTSHPYKLFNELNDLEINANHSLKYLKLHTNFNIQLNYAPSLIKLVILQYIDNSNPYYFNNNSVCQLSNLPNLKHFGYTGGCFNFQIKQFLNDLKSNQLIEIGPFEILPYSITNPQIINFLTTSPSSSIRHLKIKIDKNILISNLFNILDSNVSMENTSFSTLESIEFSFGGNEINFVVGQKKCLNLILLQLLEKLTLLKYKSIYCNLKSIVLINNQTCERCLCNNRNSDGVTCTTFLSISNYISQINQNISIYLPQSLKSIFKSSANSINHLTNLCFDRW